MLSIQNKKKSNGLHSRSAGRSENLNILEWLVNKFALALLLYTGIYTNMQTIEPSTVTIRECVQQAVVQSHTQTRASTLQTKQKEQPYIFAVRQKERGLFLCPMNVFQGHVSLREFNIFCIKLLKKFSLQKPTCSVPGIKFYRAHTVPLTSNGLPQILSRILFITQCLDLCGM